MLQTGFLPFYCAPTSKQIAHVDAWLRALPCCAVVTKSGVHYVAESATVERVTCFVDGFNYMLFKHDN